MGEREILGVTTQCLLLPTRTLHSCTTHTVSLKGRGVGGEGGGGGRGGGGGGCWGPSHSCAVSMSCQPGSSRLYYSYRTIKGGGGAEERVRWMGEREILVKQCLLLPTRTHHSYTTHAISLVRGGGAGERARWVDERGILVVVTQCLLLPTGRIAAHTVPLNITLTISPLPLP